MAIYLPERKLPEPEERAERDDFTELLAEEW